MKFIHTFNFLLIEITLSLHLIADKQTSINSKAQVYEKVKSITNLEIETQAFKRQIQTPTGNNSHKIYRFLSADLTSKEANNNKSNPPANSQIHNSAYLLKGENRIPVTMMNGSPIYNTDIEDNDDLTKDNQTMFNKPPNCVHNKKAKLSELKTCLLKYVIRAISYKQPDTTFRMFKNCYSAIKETYFDSSAVDLKEKMKNSMNQQVSFDYSNILVEDDQNSVSYSAGYYLNSIINFVLQNNCRDFSESLPKNSKYECDDSNMIRAIQNNSYFVHKSVRNFVDWSTGRILTKLILGPIN